MKTIPAFEAPDVERFFDEDEARNHERRCDYRNLIGVAASSDPRVYLLDEIQRYFPSREIWIAGGERTYRSFMPYVERFYVSRIPWTGPADRYMPEWGYDHLSGGRT